MSEELEWELYDIFVSGIFAFPVYEHSSARRIVRYLLMRGVLDEDIASAIEGHTIDLRLWLGRAGKRMVGEWVIAWLNEQREHYKHGRHRRLRPGAPQQDFTRPLADMPNAQRRRAHRSQRVNSSGIFDAADFDEQHDEFGEHGDSEYSSEETSSFRGSLTSLSSYSSSANMSATSHVTSHVTGHVTSNVTNHVPVRDNYSLSRCGVDNSPVVTENHRAAVEGTVEFRCNHERSDNDNQLTNSEQECLCRVEGDNTQITTNVVISSQASDQNVNNNDTQESNHCDNVTTSVSLETQLIESSYRNESRASETNDEGGTLKNLTSSTHASSTHASSTHASLTHASLTHASLTHASLAHASSTHVSSTHASSTHASSTHSSSTHSCQQSFLSLRCSSCLASSSSSRGSSSCSVVFEAGETLADLDQDAAAAMTQPCLDEGAGVLETRRDSCQCFVSHYARLTSSLVSQQSVLAAAAALAVDQNCSLFSSGDLSPDIEHVGPRSDHVCQIWKIPWIL